MTNDRNPPPGFEIEFDLGVLHRHAQPGTNRLLTDAAGGFATTRIEGEMSDDSAALGWIEAAPLPLLNALELRALPEGGVTLVAGYEDPLYRDSTHIVTLGFIDSFPIEPRHRPELRIERSFGVLHRRTDAERWRHVYGAGPADVQNPGGPDGVRLGGLLLTERAGYAPLTLRPDGTLSSPLLTTPSALSRIVAPARWTLAPLAWGSEKVPPAWAFRAAAGRARRFRSLPRTTAESRQEQMLGYLRPAPAPGWAPLYACHHPVIPDQYVTQSELEAHDLGFVVDGILGYVLRRLGDSEQTGPHEIAWGSRFGHRRRWREGAA